MPAIKKKSKAPFTELVRLNPAWFIEKAFDVGLWEKERQIIQSVANNQYTSVRSCHASGKSFSAGQIVIWFLHAFPESIVLTTAPTFRQVEDVLWKEIRSSYGRARVPLFGECLHTRYNIKPDHFAVGLSTDEPDKFQGYHAKHLLIVIDESSGLNPRIFDAIEGVGSTGDVRMLELGNPTDPTGHFAETFKDEFYNNIHISCFDTPNFKPFKDLDALQRSTVEERQAAVTHPYLITPQWVFHRMSKWGIDTPMFQARCLGEFPVEGTDTLIALRHALRAVERAEKLAEGATDIKLGDMNEEVLGVDVARYGDDKTVILFRKGNKVESIDRYQKQDTMSTVGRIVQIKKIHPYAKINVDDVGLGGGVSDRLRELGFDVNAINVGIASDSPEEYLNLRGQIFWNLRLRFENDDIILPNDEDLISELTSIKYKIQSNGKIKIEEKEEMKKRGLHSPDSADALALSFATGKGNAWVDYYKDSQKGEGA